MSTERLSIDSFSNSVRTFAAGNIEQFVPRRGLDDHTVEVCIHTALTECSLGCLSFRT